LNLNNQNLIFVCKWKEDKYIQNQKVITREISLGKTNKMEINRPIRILEVKIEFGQGRRIKMIGITKANLLHRLSKITQLIIPMMIMMI